MSHFLYYIIVPCFEQSYSADILDKIGVKMVKYLQVNIAVNGKSTLANPLESPGRGLKARVVSAVGKCVRERT